MNDRIAREISIDYFNWLVDLADGQNYELLLEYLHNVPFTWVVNNDENRADDGESLRNRFLYETNYTDYDLPEKSCSVLEMLVAMASRINDILIGISDEEEIARWFWELIDNLGLEYYDNVEFETDGAVDYIDDIVQVFMKREYEYDGRGGLFPLVNPMEDQRNVELWYQMSAFLEETYPSDDEY